MHKHLVSIATAFALGLFALGATAQEAAIRKNIAERIPDFPKIDEVTKTSIPGIYELRVGVDLFYSDEQGNYLFEGQVIDTRTRTNLTEARIAKLTAIDFSKLPLKDAIVWKQGSGARKLVVFADPNCGYCKKFEKDLQQVKDITVYTFLYPILGGDSPEKARNIWCAKDSTKVWREWMIDGTPIPATAAAGCDASALQRNFAMGKKYRINGTPGLVFEDGTNKPGALGAAQLEQLLTSARVNKG
ncbi:MAG: DsbC family protein [Caldimonas sp.]